MADIINDKLLPCPFCAGPAMVYDTRWHRKACNGHDGTASVTCIACGAEVHNADAAAAIAGWNRRVAPHESGGPHAMDAESNWDLAYARGMLDNYKFRVEVATFRLRQDIRIELMKAGVDCSDAAIDRVLERLSEDVLASEIARRT